MQKLTQKDIAARVATGRPFVIGRVLEVKQETLNPKAKDKAGNQIPGAPSEWMFKRATIITTASAVFGVQEFGKKAANLDAVPPLPPATWKAGDRVIVTLDGMVKDGIGYDSKGTIEVIADGDIS